MVALVPLLPGAQPWPRSELNPSAESSVRWAFFTVDTGIPMALLSLCVQDGSPVGHSHLPMSVDVSAVQWAMSWLELAWPIQSCGQVPRTCLEVRAGGSNAGNPSRHLLLERNEMSPCEVCHSTCGHGSHGQGCLCGIWPPLPWRWRSAGRAGTASWSCSERIGGTVGWHRDWTQPAGGRWSERAVQPVCVLGSVSPCGFSVQGESLTLNSMTPASLAWPG